MSEGITEAARREAEERIDRSGPYATPMSIAFKEGAEFGAAWERDRKPSDAEVEAAAGMLAMLMGQGPETDDSIRKVARLILAAFRATRTEAGA